MTSAGQSGVPSYLAGVERTNVSLVMRELVPYRLAPLLERVHSAQPEA